MGETIGPPAGAGAHRFDASGPRALALEFLRIAVGLVWALNLVFIVAPQNHWFADFSATALSYGPTTIGGPGLAQYVGAHAAVFSWLVAIVTTYLAAAFLLGFTTRLACLVGGVFSSVLLATQVGSTFVFPGGTDVGEHPLYLVIYIALVVGGAGRALSVDRWLSETFARRHAAHAARGLPAPRRAWTAGPSYRFFLAYFTAGILVSFAVTLGLMVAVPSSAPNGSGPTPVYYENLTVSLNPVNGWPQYTPANFTVPAGRVVFTITDHDSPMNWSQCPCVVSGTDKVVEMVNGSPDHIVPSSNVAHSFNIPQLGLDVYTPGQSVVVFTVDLVNSGTFVWFCIVPCGAGANPYTTPPMGTPGVMTGTMTVS